jgi:hypothetical protein
MMKIRDPFIMHIIRMAIGNTWSPLWLNRNRIELRALAIMENAIQENESQPSDTELKH